MDWRNNIIIYDVLKNLVSNIESNLEPQRHYSQIGFGDSPENAIFTWDIEKNKDGTNKEVTKTYWETFKRNRMRAKFTINHNFGLFTNLFQIENIIDNMYEKFMNEQLKNFKENDSVSVNINHDNLDGTNIFIHPFFKKDFNKQSFFNAIYEVAQSNSSFLISGDLRLEVNVTTNLSGSGNKKSRVPQTKDQKRTNARSVIEIFNEDNGCCFHALVVAVKKQELLCDEKYEWQCIRRDTGKLRTKFALELAKKCGFDLSKPVTIEDFSLIDGKIGYQIIVVDDNNPANRLFVGNPETKKIYLSLRKTVLNEYHYDAVVNIKAFIGKSFFCEHCHKGYNNYLQHKCNFLCERCFQHPPCGRQEIKIICQKCNFEFFGFNCYNKHNEGSNTVCSNYKKCKDCLQEFYGKKHECDVKICKICNKPYKLEKHFCYLKTIEEDKLIESDGCEKFIVAYDIESQQKNLDINSSLHVPDLLISMTTCSKCWLIEENRRNKDCDFCGEFENIFFGKGCVKMFGDYLYNYLSGQASKQDCYIYVFAQNAKGYDNHFILNDLFTRHFEDTNVIMCGNKALKASVGNIKFLDSLLMFQQPLAALPKAFGFENIVTKGFFPHDFHTSINIDYEGDIPDRSFFGINYMKSKQIKEFEKWYSQESRLLYERNIKYNLKSELIKYCKNDVLILLNCIQMFRKIYKKVTKIDPITRCFTLASMGLEIFKAKILPPETIGVTPIKGYGNRGTFSRIGNCWLDYQQKILDIEIQREVPLDKYIVDGIHLESNKVFEYNGCYYHCHNCVYKENRDTIIIKNDGTSLDKTPNQIFEETNKKANHLRKRGFDLVEEWDCELKKKRRLDPELDDYFIARDRYYKDLTKYGGVSIRDSFKGGRTNNVKFICDVTDDPASRILYYDFRSLYPTVLKYKEFPVGHPKVINEDFDDIRNYFGFIKCILKAPDDMYIPVLPVHTKKRKLIFPLCTKCAEDMNPHDCTHDDEERNLIGTWTTVELNYALEKGYEIVKIIEVYHYREKTNEIFSGYINLWLKLKQQADGWPAWVKNDEDKQKYIDNFLKNEGVQLDEKEIEVNPGLRFIAKLFLNTLWGKLAQRPNLQQTKVCSEYKDYWEIVNDEDKLIKGELMVNDDCLLVNWEYKDDEMGKNANTSLAIASFVTSYARIELMKIIDEVEIIPGRVLYWDTDSLIFRYRDGEPKPSTDDYLGCLADEISKDYGVGAICTKFCSLGPKVYAMEIWPENATEPIVPIKVKGITLTDKALDIIKMESMVKLAEDYIKNNGDQSNCSSLQIPQFQIRPTPMKTIETKYFSKIFRAMSEKRRINGNDTLPYGFKDRTITNFLNMILD